MKRSTFLPKNMINDPVNWPYLGVKLDLHRSAQSKLYIDKAKGLSYSSEFISQNAQNYYVEDR